MRRADYKWLMGVMHVHSSMQMFYVFLGSSLSPGPASIAIVF